MSIELILYLIPLIGKINGIFRVLGLICLALIVFSIMVFLSSSIDENAKETCNCWALKYTKIFSIMAILFFGCWVFVPNEKTLYLMTIAHIGKDAYQSPIAQKAISSIEKKLDEYLKDEK